MSFKTKSFEAVAKDIKLSHGSDYSTISANQTSTKERPQTDGKILFTEEEKEKMFAENYKLIYHVANRYVIKGGIEKDELYHSGLLGMVKALNTYDKNLGEAKFSTYAIRCITNEVLYFMRRERKHREDHEGNHLHHLEDSLKMDENGKPFEKGDTIEDESLPNMDDVVYQSEQHQAIMTLLDKCLNDNERYIIVKRYALDGAVEEMTQKDIAQILDMSQANVSKLQKNAEEKLLKYLKGITHNKQLTLVEAKEQLGGLERARQTTLDRYRRHTAIA